MQQIKLYFTIYVVSALITLFGIKRSIKEDPKHMTSTMPSYMYDFIILFPVVNSIFAVVVIYSICSAVLRLVYRLVYFIVVSATDYIRRLFGYYDSRGLKYSIRHLEMIRKNIPFWTRQHQAEYVDSSTMWAVKYNPYSVQKDILSETDDAMCNNPAINSTDIGNMAYIVLNHGEENVRKKADIMLDKLREHEIKNK